jgi:hypothetical protein
MLSATQGYIIIYNNTDRCVKLVIICLGWKAGSIVILGYKKLSTTPLPFLPLKIEGVQRIGKIPVVSQLTLNL